MDDLAGKVAVVTGAASGIGFAMAARFAAEGMNVVLSDIEPSALDEAVARIESSAELLTVVTDVSVETEVEALAAAAIDRFGAVHVVCNNAGVGSRGLMIDDLPRRDFEWVFGVNLWGVIHGIRSFLPHLEAHGDGHIVNTASISGVYHLPRMGPYNASKAAVLALSETLQFELDARGSNVGVSVLMPGFVRTNISQAVRNLPERFHYELTPEQAAEMTEYKSRRRTQARDGMDAADVADMVVDAIRERRFYIVTHIDSIDEMRARFDRIVNGENPIAPPG